MSRGSANVENHRKVVPGIELAAKHEHTLERAGSYPNSNRRRIVSDVSLFRYVTIGWLDIYDHSTNPVNISGQIETESSWQQKLIDSEMVVVKKRQMIRTSINTGSTEEWLGTETGNGRYRWQPAMESSQHRYGYMTSNKSSLHRKMARNRL